MLNSEEDFKKIIEKSKEILIISPENSIDVKVSSFALVYLLEKIDKNVTLFSSKTDSYKISFLPKPIKTINNLNGFRDFQLIFNTERNKIVKTRTEEKEKEYIIHITPEKGAINPKDFSFIPAKFKFDLIIILGSPALENLGKIYFSNTDLFFEVPKINIDYNPQNENYGQVNIIEETASSIGEIITELIFNNYSDLMDKRIAQSLLTGIISATESFQIPTTSPKSMNLAAQLMKQEADQPTIVRYLYLSKDLAFLKLWGRIMARINWDKEKKLVWSLVSQEDFVQSSADEEYTPTVLEELQKSFPQNQTCLIIYGNKKNETVALLKIVDEKKMKLLKEIYETEEEEQLLKINFGKKNLIEAEKDLFQKMIEKDF
jgi:nanoRNase/pAp phosphatase (c-di-AMP/oligoRNAs hydrolase)